MGGSYKGSSMSTTDQIGGALAGAWADPLDLSGYQAADARMKDEAAYVKRQEADEAYYRAQQDAKSQGIIDEYQQSKADWEDAKSFTRVEEDDDV